MNDTKSSTKEHGANFLMNGYGYFEVENNLRYDTMTPDNT